MNNDLKLALSPDKFETLTYASHGGVKEKAIFLERPRAAVVGTVFVDDPERLSPRLVQIVRDTALVISSSFEVDIDGMKNIVKLRGQLGLIRVEELARSPDAKRARTSDDVVATQVFLRYSVDPATARRNIMNQTILFPDGPSHYGVYQQATISSVTHQPQETLVEFPDGGVVPDPDEVVQVRQGSTTLDPITWKFVDKTTGKRIGSDERRHEFTKAAYSFKKAVNYQVTAGHKIGMVVWRWWDIDKKDAQYTGTDQSWLEKRKELFGAKGSPCVYTGEIVRVSNDSRAFEHNINSFKGCSGAIIFLLDRNQPDGFDEEWSDCAIGIHVGAAPAGILGSEVSLGFSIP
ncbi:expressed unknown protein [Seminavis robusta]|uniref:Uncharacterized protein n=1 Tax=Seminavis robusta TaxID=568900 RepID=A0A9N8ECL4_9STRA|nr:expressed unknown protein [Seminavis robusta]|eukprot:Sro926_g220960.1 n/a (348) ;mRNA; f:2261-3304